jgi:hypothetical protein
MELAPGATAMLHVVVNLHNRSGPQRFISQIVVDGEELPWICALETTIYQKAAFEPREVNIGFLKANEKAHSRVSLETSAGPNTQLPVVTAIAAQASNVTVAMADKTSETLPDGVKRCVVPVEIEVTPNGESATNRTTVEATVDCGGEMVTASLPITWSIVPIYEVGPAHVFFGDVTGQSKPTEARVALRWPDGKLVTIRQLVSTSGAVTASISPSGPANVHTIRLVLDPNGLKESLDGAITGVADDDAKTEIRIPFAAFVK